VPAAGEGVAAAAIERAGMCGGVFQQLGGVGGEQSLGVGRGGTDRSRACRRIRGSRT